MNYHCFSKNEEIIKCLNCGNELYYDINHIKKDEITQKRIIDIYCIKCKLIFDTTKIYFPCKICGKNFKAQPQIYQNFSSSKKFLFILIHSFRKRKYALPSQNSSQMINKTCNCNLNGIIYHSSVQKEFDQDDDSIKYCTKISDASHKSVITDLLPMNLNGVNLLVSSSWDGTIKIWK